MNASSLLPALMAHDTNLAESSEISESDTELDSIRQRDLRRHRAQEISRSFSTHRVPDFLNFDKDLTLDLSELKREHSNTSQAPEGIPLLQPHEDVVNSFGPISPSRRSYDAIAVPSVDENIDPIFPELTIKGVLLAVVLSIVLGAANAYLGLVAGMTISVSIPSAILAMTILKATRLNTNMLEINAVQTGATAGSAIAAGVIYTIPALVILGEWNTIKYFATTVVALSGGILGVLFSMPLRRALVVESPTLTFPEGMATAELLKVMSYSTSRTHARLIAIGGLVGLLQKLMVTGFQFWSDQLLAAASFGRSGVVYIGISTSPALSAVGYIVKIQLAFTLFVGAAINWWIITPITAIVEHINMRHHPREAITELWNEQTRFVGVGMMLVGGLGTLAFMMPSIISGLRSGVRAVTELRKRGGMANIPRRERDIPIVFMAIAVVVFFGPLYYVSWTVSKWWVAALVCTLYILIAGFLFSAVGGYMSGLVGSSNNPISGVTLATIITAALLMLSLRESASGGMAAAIIVGGVVCCAAAISGDNLQDLKAGHILGSTPYKLQVMQIIGVGVAAFVIAPIVMLLDRAYKLPREGSSDARLSAPQASLMASVVDQIFNSDLSDLKYEYTMIGIGAGLALLTMVVDGLFVKLAPNSGIRVPVLAVALGMYLPFDLSTPIFLGGVVAWIADKTLHRLRLPEAAQIAGHRKGLLFASGLITGEALVGILIAIPIVITDNPNVLAFLGAHDAWWPALICLVLTMVALYLIITIRREQDTDG